MRAYGISNKGTVRSENQDRFLLEVREEQDTALMVLCDGMGGTSAGSLAAELAADAFMTHAELCLKEKEPPEAAVIVRESAAYANIRVYDRARSDSESSGMGTTLVGVLIQGEKTALVNIGDSRGYLFSNGILSQITRDHSLVEELVQRGAITRAEARVHPKKNLITRAVGLDYREKCDIFEPVLKRGDVLLLCSDGLSNALGDDGISKVLKKKREPETACRSLVESALRKGASDNITAVVFCR